MRGLLLACLILFAAISLPAGAQNEDNITLAAEPAQTDTGLQPDNPPPADSPGLDPLTQTILGSNSEDGSLPLDEDTQTKEISANEEIAEGKASSNLDSLISSSDSLSEESGTYDSGEAENVTVDYEPELNISEELFQTINAFDQSEEAIMAQPEIAFADQKTDMEITESEDFQAIRRELSSDKDENNQFNNFYSGDNLAQITYIKDDFKNKVLGYSNMPAEYREAEVQPVRSVVYSGTEPVVTDDSANSAIRDQYSRFESNFEVLSLLADDSGVGDPNVAGLFREISSQMDKLQDPHPKGVEISKVLPQFRPSTLSDIVHAETLNGAGFTIAADHKKQKKYAVVVGINQYSDRQSLRASVNDAEEMAGLLKGYGYEVIELTDNTAMKPTKHNILEGAIEEIKMKPDRGSVVIYFSGHGEKDENGNFYLIPQNANGDPSNYISKEELKQYITGIKDLSLIVDSCYSGELTSIKEDGQVIVASSENIEPSNEIWTEPRSLFTHLLCKAINETETGKGEGEIPLQSSFNKAQRETIELSRVYWQRQNPIIS